MNVFYGLVLYVSIGGLMTSFVFNDYAEKCGSPQKLENDFFELAYLWPAALVNAALIKDDLYIKSDSCVK